MLGLNLRSEFTGKRLSGTTIDFTNRQGTGALDKPASDFLNITYPSIDLLKTIEAVEPGKSRPTVIIGARGQGKSHLMAALSHMLRDSVVGRNWLDDWSVRLGNPAIASLALRTDLNVIVESLHLHNYKFLWDLLFDKHPNGAFIKGKWLGQGDNKTEVPGYELLVELFQQQPTLLILDEFQTWYEGLTNNKQYPWRNWAFNFIQILSEIAEKNPELLALVVSVRDGVSDAAQQIFRVNPVRIDFKGPQAKKDRQKLLLYRLFENRMQINDSDIETVIVNHVNEYLRLNHISGADHEKVKQEFIDAWPYAPHLLKLLDDQVLIATETQETRDLIRILVDVFKTAGKDSPIITAADFSITNENSGVSSLLDSVANQMQRNLRDKALRNYEAVRDATASLGTPTKYLEPILSSLWLRSLSIESMAGAEAHELQVDITRHKPIDDNQFQAELALVEENSFNIHRKGNRLIFLNEENPQAKLMAHAKNDRLFEKGEDQNYLADEIRYVLAGSGDASQSYRVLILKRSWSSDPWSDIDERDQPQNWDNRIPVIVLPSSNVSDAELGKWLKAYVPKNRNTVRFLLAQKVLENVFYDKSLLVLARAVFLAAQWKKADSEYSSLHIKYQKELRDQLNKRFDRFAILEIWNFADPQKCEFITTSHNAEGSKILSAIQEHIQRELFIPEEFKELVLASAESNHSVAQVLNQLKEPKSGGEPSVPWLGEVEAKEKIIRLCAQGTIAINLLGRELLERRPGESEDEAWQRMKGRLASGRQLEETTLHEPGTTVSSGGSVVVPPLNPPEPPTTNPKPGEQTTGNNGNEPTGFGLFGGTSSGIRDRTRLNAPATSSLNLLGKLEGWGINPGSQVYGCKVSIDKMTGAQLQELLKKLPDGITYSLDLEKD
ncbi:ATP-binding protein [Methylicorpusculum oleiharenae]|uniref:DUF499 domain-containing protein n=1 Tax=Methylicorpusculum oleiharenae TaxID=1338687 RepID=UPI001358C993|nr:DUF499 domain-containing protein [Methylicorpusculum oleiharenae]MCD2451124.1 ATP-binding protein [Methylicorpusculum oleiharenae]